MSKLKAVLIVLVSMLVVGGGASYVINLQQQEQARENMSEERLRERVQERWEAIMAFDFFKVFEYSTPAYQAAFDVGHLSSQYGGQVKRTKVDVANVEFVEGSKTDAVVSISIYFMLKLQPGFESEEVSVTRERWSVVDGQWYFLSTL